jgi:hypothetical protein
LLAYWRSSVRPALQAGCRGTLTATMVSADGIALGATALASQTGAPTSTATAAAVTVRGTHVPGWSIEFMVPTGTDWTRTTTIEAASRRPRRAFSSKAPGRRGGVPGASRWFKDKCHLGPCSASTQSGSNSRKLTKGGKLVPGTTGGIHSLLSRSDSRSAATSKTPLETAMVLGSGRSSAPHRGVARRKY